MVSTVELSAALRRELRGDVRDDAYTRHLYAADASMYAVEPLLVAFPRGAEDIAAAIALAARFDVPVVSRGGGTSLSGQTAGGRGIVLDTSRYLNEIRELDPEARRVRVGPGVVQEDLNRAARAPRARLRPGHLDVQPGHDRRHDRQQLVGLAVDRARHDDRPRARAGRRARRRLARHVRPGPRRYLSAIESGLREILRDHARAIAEDYPKHWRQSGGYRLDRLAREFDLAKFVTGSEGTLVAITEATVRLVELPKATMFAVGHFDSLSGAIAATADALELGPTTVEMIDRTILDLSRSKLEYRKLSETLEGDPEALLFVSFAGDTDDEVRGKLDELAAAWQEHGHGYHTLRAETAAEQDALTKVRKAGLGLLMAASEGAARPAAFVEDTAVAPERLNDYVARFREVLDRHDLQAGFYGHCSVGCLHIRPFVDLTAPGGVETMESVAGEIASLVAEFDGVNSSEHGDGRVRSPFNPQVFGEDLYEAMRKVKRLFDPANRLNPGIMVDASPITVNLRDPALPPPGPLADALRLRRRRDARAPPTAASASACAARPAAA